jgi:hypothetical protein
MSIFNKIKEDNKIFVLCFIRPPSYNKLYHKKKIYLINLLSLDTESI